MNVLSLFDGMSCGQIALERAGIKVDNYFASEIDKYAIKVTQNNYPNTIQLGDVTKIFAKDLPKIDLLIGGSPCQGFSFAGKQLNFDDPRSKLFFEYVRLFEETNPKYFLLENVKMKKDYEQIITNYLGVDSILIDSRKFTAQNRRRLYWTNIPIPNITTHNDVVLDDVIDHTNTTERVITKNLERYVPNNFPKYCDPYNRKEISEKSTTLRTNVSNGNMWIRVDGGYRNLTTSECEKLQGVPIGYTDGVSSTQAKKMLGNGWTVDVIAHIFMALERSESHHVNV
jgi:DNA (cytosine-5)-methyltransferase 3A